MKKLYYKIQLKFWSSIVKKVQRFWFWCKVKKSNAQVGLWIESGVFDSEKSRNSLDKLIEDYNNL